MRTQPIIVAAVLYLIVGANASAAGPKGLLPIKAALQNAPHELKKFIGPQVRRIGKMPGPRGSFGNLNGKVVGTAHAFRGKKGFRSATIDLFGKVGSVTTNGRDGQFWFRTASGDTDFREHGFVVGPRNRKLKNLGFKVGERVCVETTRVKGRVVTQTVKTIRPGLVRYSRNLLGD